MQTSKEYVDSTLGLTQTFWAPIIEKELREQTIWGNLLFDPNYTMERVKGGDTLKISYIKKPTSSIRTIGTNADSFESNVLESTQVDLVVDKRAVSAYAFEDLGILMSQLESEDSEIREALLSDVREQMNDWIKSNISPSTSSPDHVITSVSDFNNSQLGTINTLGNVAKWTSSRESKYLVVDPVYHNDLVGDSTIGASNIMGTNQSPMIAGQFATQRYGYNILMDDSLSTDTGFAFIPSFMKLVFGEPRFKISDLHAQNKFGYNISVDFPLGLVQLDNKRVISIEN